MEKGDEQAWKADSILIAGIKIYAKMIVADVQSISQ